MYKGVYSFCFCLLVPCLDQGQGSGVRGQAHVFSVVTQWFPVTNKSRVSELRSWCFVLMRNNRPIKKGLRLKKKRNERKKEWRETLTGNFIQLQNKSTATNTSFTHPPSQCQSPHPPTPWIFLTVVACPPSGDTGAYEAWQKVGDLTSYPNWSWVINWPPETGRGEGRREGFGGAGRCEWWRSGVSVRGSSEASSNSSTW